MNLSTITADIKARITTIPLNEPVFIYIGVGTYAGLKNKDGILEPQNYHQYPPFLQSLKNKIADLNLFIVLIDPMQEQPPYLMGDKGLLLNNNNNNSATASAIAPTTSAHVTNKIANAAPAPTASGIAACAAPAPTASGIAACAAPAPTASGIAVFSLLQKVYTDPYECYGDSTNITADLRDINKYAMEENITLLYHDFTGRRNSLLAEYFDPELKSHLDHIVYGMSARQDHGCYFDLSEASAYFPWGRCLSVTLALAPGAEQNRQSGAEQNRQTGAEQNRQTGAEQNRQSEAEQNRQTGAEQNRQTGGETNQPILPTGVGAGVTDRQRPLIKLFNIFHYIVNDSLNLIAQDAQHYSHDMADVNTMINTQIEQVISTIKSDLTNHMLSLLRVIFRLIVGDEQRASINIDHSFNFIALPHRARLFQLYNENNYVDLYTNLIDYFSRDIHILSKLKNHDLSGKEILQFIVNSDKPYEWCSNVKHFF